MKKKTMGIILLASIFALVIIYLAGSGFREQPNVVLTDYTLSPDGGEMLLSVAVSSPMGYIRGFKDHGGGVKPHYLTFFATFGGINSRLGAEQSFSLALDPQETEIYFNRSNGGYELVLFKERSTGVWQRPTE